MYILQMYVNKMKVTIYSGYVCHFLKNMYRRN